MNAQHRILRATLAGAWPLLVAGCVINMDDDDGATGSTSATDGPTGSDTTGSEGDAVDTTGSGGETVSTHGSEHCGTVEDAQIWAADLNPHRVTCDVLIEGGSVTVGPGVEILVADDAGIHLSEQGSGGTLIVDGNADEPVDIHAATGAGAGQWRGIGIFNGAEQAELRHVRVADAGGFNAQANVLVEQVEATLEHVHIDAAEELGLLLLRGGRLTPSSTGLTVSGSTGYPVRVDPGQAHTLPAADSDYTGNTEDAIAVQSSGTDWNQITTAVTWEDLGVPYDAIDSLSLSGVAGDPAVLTLEAGVTVRFATQSALDVGVPGGAAGLTCAGTRAQPVVLTALDSVTRGAWTGVRVEQSVADGMVDLEQTIIEYGGGFNGTACISAAGPELDVDGVTLDQCEDAGFRLSGGARFGPTSQALRVLNSDLAGETLASTAHSVGIPGADYTGNDRDVVQVIAPGTDRIETAVTWASLGVPYHIVNGVRVEGTAEDPALLTLLPGAQLRFDSDSGLDVSPTGGAGGLRAEGTAEDPIYFGAADADVPGAWTGIRIYSGALASELVLDWIDVAWGGGLNSESNIRIEDASPIISNAIIRSSDCWGIEIWGTAMPQLESINYMDNTCGDIGP